MKNSKLENNTQILNSKLENTENMLKNTTKQLENALLQQKALNSNFENTVNVLINTTNTLEKINKQFNYFFSNKWIQFKTFLENNTRKALIFQYKTKPYINRSEAIEICKQNNATLVDIESIDKQKLVQSFLYQINPHKEPSAAYFLSGYTDSLDKYKFKWLKLNTQTGILLSSMCICL